MATTTTKKFYIKETDVADTINDVSVVKRKGWQLQEVPTATAIADVATAASATAAGNATAINSILAALRAAGIVAPNA